MHDFENSDLVNPNPLQHKAMARAMPGETFRFRYTHQLETKRYALRRKLGATWMFMGERQRDAGDMRKGAARGPSLWGSFDRAKLWMTEGRARLAIPARSKGIEIVEVTCLVSVPMTCKPIERLPLVDEPLEPTEFNNE